MLKPYRISLSVASRLGTPLAADTLWGHIAWGVRYAHGAAALEQWLARYDAGDPPLVLSDPLPAGMLPRPVLPPAPPQAARPATGEWDARKDLDGARWIPLEAWREAAGRLDGAALATALKTHDHLVRAPSAITVSTLHAPVNRLTGSTAGETGGLLHTLEDTFFDAGRGDDCATRFDVWALSPDSVADVQALFEVGLSGGYGRDASSGAGDVRIETCKEESLPSVAGANAAMLLGPATPRPTDPARGFFDFVVRAGRLGGEFAVGATPDGSTERQKRPVVCLSRGTVLVGDCPGGFVGGLVAGVHPYAGIRHYAMAPVLQCRLTDAAMKEAR